MGRRFSSHYVYRYSDPETGQYYLGAFGTRIDPHEDLMTAHIEPFGLGKRRAAQRAATWKREVLAVYATGYEAHAHLQSAVREAGRRNDPLIVNRGARPYFHAEVL